MPWIQAHSPPSTYPTVHETQVAKLPYAFALLRFGFCVSIQTLHDAADDDDDDDYN